MAIGAYQDALVYFLSDSVPTSSESILRNPEILAAMGMMEFERVLTPFITATGTLSAFVLDRAPPHGLAPFGNRPFQVLSTISIGSCVWHPFIGIPSICPQSPALPLSYAGIFDC
ncbi:MAG: hypothetical protein IPJ68_06175 [Candidatus Moraniibacteriota bacterium]|nr:MAG: hypothetical protein IPJ68_06175 [Candidatus Moranbacteria bacterium]